MSKIIDKYKVILETRKANSRGSPDISMNYVKKNIAN
jgi:hypothetical protein